IATAQRVYRSYGFSPIDTPALEYLEILSGKGGEESDKQMYRFTDHGGREVGMRFDLTVPLARFAAQHFAELGTPFKRYHIASVWRGENTQRGRYREFMQCDFDTIGTLSPVADIETALVIHDLLRAIGFEEFTIHVNNRMVLNGLLAKLGLEQQSKAVLIALDKVRKIGPEKVAEEMAATAGASASQAAAVLQLSQIEGTSEEVLRKLTPLVEGNELGQNGVARLAELVSTVQLAGVAAERLVIDAVIARGLDYYTGTIFETFLDDLPDLGSICSGGRYDNLAELYTKQQLPGIGASLGLDRLLAGMEELGMLPKVSTPAAIFIPYFDAGRLADYLRLAAQLRAAGFGVEVYPEAKKLGQQLKYADRRGFQAAIVAGENEFAAGNVQLKNLATTTSETVPLSAGAAELIAALKRLLGDAG
ncbi:MAG TPA: histidine--tRNA ligase, partial [Pirellulales bacterium]